MCLSAVLQSFARNTAYSNVADFEKNFASDGAAFVKELTAEVRAGSGALVTGNMEGYLQMLCWFRRCISIANLVQRFINN